MKVRTLVSKEKYSFPFPYFHLRNTSGWVISWLQKKMIFSFQVWGGISFFNLKWSVSGDTFLRYKLRDIRIRIVFISLILELAKNTYFFLLNNKRDSLNEQQYEIVIELRESENLPHHLIKKSSEKSP